MTAANLALLYEWRDVGSFSLLADSLQSELGADLWARPRLSKEVKEALSLGAFARAIHARRCRLFKPDPPDAEVEDNQGDLRRVEITMVLTPGRRIGDEYENAKHSPSKLYHIEQEELEYADKRWREWLLDGVGKKFEGPPKFDDLVVYNNISNLFGAKGWETLADQLREVVPDGWSGRIWQHGSVELHQLWPETRRLTIPS